MVKNLEELGMAVGIPHQRDKWKVDDEDSEADWKKEEGFIFLGYGQIDKQASHDPHDDNIPLEVEYPRRVEDAVQHVQDFVDRHSVTCSSFQPILQK
jgi:hypothetical protein